MHLMQEHQSSLMTIMSDKQKLEKKQEEEKEDQQEQQEQQEQQDHLSSQIPGIVKIMARCPVLGARGCTITWVVK